MDAGSIVFVEIPVGDLARAADFYAGLFGWSFEEEDADHWRFAPGGRGPMGRLTTRRPVSGQGVMLVIAVDDVDAALKRAIELGGGTGEAVPTASPEVGDHAVLIDPDGTHIAVFQSRLGRRGQRGDVTEEA